MSHTTVVGVHGIGRQYESPVTLLRDWREDLGGGVWLAGGPRTTFSHLDIAFYGDVFRPPGPGGGGRKGAPTVDDVFAELDDEERTELAAAAAEVLTEEELARAQQEGGDKGYSRSPLPLQTALRALDRRFGAAAGVLYLGTLRQVRRYLGDPETKAEVDARVDAAVGEDVRVLVGHSLGSVVAYEYLLRRPLSGPLTLITLGSPLGLRMVRSRLTTVADPTARWVAVRDRHDPVACAGSLAPWWRVDDEPVVDNGSDAHAVSHYLTAEAVGRAVLAAA